MPLPGRSRRAGRSTDSVDKCLRGANGSLVYCLHISNIPLKCEEELKSKLQTYGGIKSFFMQKGNNNLTSTYAFVTYATPAEASRLFSRKDELRLNGRKLYVSIADIWHQPTVGPDGSVNYTPYRGYRRPKSEDEDDEEDEEDEGGGNEAMTEEDRPPILKLNDDCMRCIVELLPFSDRHVIGQVCRRWRAMMSSYWSKFSELDFCAEPFVDAGGFSNARLSLYLQLCPEIRVVRLGNPDGALSLPDAPNSLSVITVASLCPRLEELTLSNLQLKNRPLATVAHYCKRLKSLTLHSCKFPDRDNEMNNVMKQCSQLENLKLSNCILKPGHWLKGLPPSLRTLSFLACQMSHPNLIEGLGKVKESLESLELVVDLCSPPLDLHVLEGFPRLTSLSYLSRSARPQGSTRPLALPHLTTLCLSSNSFLSDQLVTGLVTASPLLTVLGLACCDLPGLTPDGLKELGNLARLEELDISRARVTDNVLAALASGPASASLRVLSINFCLSVTDAGTKRIVEECPNLKELNADGCPQVTDKTVEAAVTALASATSKRSLLVVQAAGSGVTREAGRVSEGVELVTVRHTNFSWLLSNSLHNFNDFLVEDFYDSDFDPDVDDDDDDEYGFDIYDEEDDIFYHNPYEFDLELEEDIDGIEPLDAFNIFFNFL